MPISPSGLWKLLADYEAKLLRQRIANKSIVVQQDSSSNFSATFFNLLSSSLVSNGALVVTNNDYDSVNVSYKVNIVTNNWGKQPPEVDTIPGEVVHYLLAGSFEILKAPIYTVKDQFIKNLSTATEVVITTQATTPAGQLLYSASNIYFIEGSNSSQYIGYESESPAYKAGDARTISVVGSQW